jgi:hypothetical protein
MDGFEGYLLQAVGAGALALSAALGLGVRWLVAQLRNTKNGIGDDLVRSLATRLARTTPDPDAYAAEASDADRVLGDLSRRVGREVRRENATIIAEVRALDRRVGRIEQDISVLLDHDAATESWQRQHSGRIGAVETAVEDVSASIRIDEG